MTLDTGRDLVKKINQETRKSTYYNHLTQHKYRHVKGYTAYDDVMFELARTRFTYDYYPIEFFQEDFVHKTSLLTINSLFTEGFKPLWLSPNLFQAFLHTDLPTQLTAFQRVVKNVVLFLPHGLITPDGTDVRWLIFAHNLATDTFPDIRIGNKVLHTLKNDYDAIALTFYDAQRYQYSTNRALYLVDGKLDTELGRDNFILRTREEDNEDAEKEFMDIVFNLVVNTLLYLQTYEEKELAQKLHVNTTHVKNTRSSKHVKLEPHIVGENYKTKNTYEKRHVQVGVGSKKSVHWRRGHYRNQVVGKREKETREHKLVWIEPVLVNAENNV